MKQLLLCACVILVCQVEALRGEVIYTDIDDTVVNQSGGLGSFEVDLNGDAIDDVRFQHQFFSPNDIKSPVFGLGTTKIGTHEALFTAVIAGKPAETATRGRCLRQVFWGI